MGVDLGGQFTRMSECGVFRTRSHILPGVFPDFSGLLRAPDFEQARAPVAKLVADCGAVGVLLAGCPVEEVKLPGRFGDDSSDLTTRLDDTSS